jgi:hypothetical protein
MNRTLTAAVLPAIAALATPAAAEIITVRYDFPSTASISLDWFYFGADHGPVTGWITSTSVVIENYTTTGAQDAANFSMSFAVPVLDADDTAVVLNGADLGWSGSGSFSHSFTSPDFNGEIRPGRFGAEFQGGGTFAGQAYIEFTVDTVPAPGVLALFGGAGLLVGRRRR